MGLEKSMNGANLPVFLKQSMGLILAYFVGPDLVPNCLQKFKTLKLTGLILIQSVFRSLKH